jgi:hypothetical protein
MPTVAPATTEAAIWERVIHPEGQMTRETARHILQLGFSEAEQRRMKELAARNRAGTLTPEEEASLDNFCRVGSMLSILQSRARRVLKSRRSLS